LNTNFEETEMKPFDYYSKSQTAYPNKQDYIQYFVYDRGEVLEITYGYEKSKSQLEKEYPDAVIQVVMDNEGYKEHKKQYGEETHKLYEEFVNDLFELFGVTDNPKRQKAFDLTTQQALNEQCGTNYNFFQVATAGDNLSRLCQIKNQTVTIK